MEDGQVVEGRNQARLADGPSDGLLKERGAIHKQTDQM